jgi:hypothetical protein
MCRVLGVEVVRGVRRGVTSWRREARIAGGTARGQIAKDMFTLGGLSKMRRAYAVLERRGGGLCAWKCERKRICERVMIPYMRHYASCK